MVNDDEEVTDAEQFVKEVEGEIEPEPETPSKELLESFAALEEVLNEGAQKLADNERIPHGKWRITLVAATKGSAVLRLKKGPVAQIILTWPSAQQNLKRLLQDAFRAIRINKMYEAFEIEPVLYARRNKEALRKWYRQEFGEESDILLDLIPKWRMEEIVETKYTLRDVKTGISISVTNTKTGHFSQQRIDNWVALSREVRKVEPIMIDVEDETPELDEAQNGTV